MNLDELLSTTNKLRIDAGCFWCADTDCKRIIYDTKVLRDVLNGRLCRYHTIDPLTLLGEYNKLPKREKIDEPVGS